MRFFYMMLAIAMIWGVALNVNAEVTNEDRVHTVPFTEEDAFSSEVIFQNFHLDRGNSYFETNILRFIVEIGNAKNGQQRLYIRVLKSKGITMDLNDPDSIEYSWVKHCEPLDYIKDGFKTIVARVNGQPVMFTQFCEGGQLSITPQTNNGLDFLVNAFTKGKSVLFDQLHTEQIDVSAMGFNHAWNTYGGNAI